MGVEGATKVIKFLVFFFNFIFFVFGCVLIGIGAWTLIEFGDYVTLTESVPYATAPNVMIAAGVLIAIVSFLGCCGAWKENRCMLVIFFICLIVILALEITAGALGYVNRDKLEETLDENFSRELEQRYNETGSEGSTKLIDKLQEEEKCCGFNSSRDWYTSKFGGNPHRFPDSCCIKKENGCGAKNDVSLVYKEGCKEKLEKLLIEKLYIIGAIGVTIAVIQILGMIFAMVLICKIGEGTYA